MDNKIKVLSKVPTELEHFCLTDNDVANIQKLSKLELSDLLNERTELKNYHKVLLNYKTYYYFKSTNNLVEIV